jgi:hypothetical protein
VIADPAGYQARVAPLRVRRLERLAREALDAGRPFAALALCDRGLAYAPDHAGLAALVTEVEIATASAGTAATIAGSAPVRPAALAVAEAAAAPVVTTGGRPAVAAVATTVSPRRHLGWWIGGGLAGAGFIAMIVILAMPGERRARTGPRMTAESTANDENTKEGLAVARGLVSVFDRAMTQQERTAAAGGRVAPDLGPAPTTAGGWLDRAAKQPPAEALLSVRQALALQPGWQRARDRLCELLAAVEDPEATTVCVDRAECVADGMCAANPGR